MAQPDIAVFIAISDPGEVNRAEHTRADRLVILISNIVAWAFPILMLCIVAQVILRGVGNNQAWLDDLQWWVYGFAMMAGLAYAITTNSHVRVDILHQNYSVEKKARVEAFALGWMLLPFLFLMTDILFHYAVASIVAGEGSDSPNGLHRLYILKTTMPFLFVIAGIAAWSAFRRNLEKYSEDTVRTRLIWAFPAIVFVTWRILHYIVYWVVRVTNSDLNPRRITKEPVFESLLSVAFVLVVLAIAVSYLMRHRSQSGEGL